MGCVLRNPEKPKKGSRDGRPDHDLILKQAGRIEQILVDNPEQGGGNREPLGHGVGPPLRSLNSSKK